MISNAEGYRAGVAAASRRRMRATPANNRAKAGRLRHTMRRLKNVTCMPLYPYQQKSLFVANNHCNLLCHILYYRY
jgi:hypothetical protein